MPSDGTWSMTGFKNTTVDVPIPLEDLEKEYCRLTSQPYPIPEMVFVRSWMLFRVRLEIFFVSNIDDPSIHSCPSSRRVLQPAMPGDRQALRKLTFT
jgi:hypothetical protein